MVRPHGDVHHAIFVILQGAPDSVKKLLLPWTLAGPLLPVLSRDHSLSRTVILIFLLLLLVHLSLVMEPGSANLHWGPHKHEHVCLCDKQSQAF